MARDGGGPVTDARPAQATPEPRAEDPGARRAALVAEQLAAHAEFVRARGRVDADLLADLGRDVDRLARDADTPGSEAEPSGRTLADFLAEVRGRGEPSWLVRELLPDEGVAVWHGRPRSMKSLTALDVALSLASGETRALRCPRFGVARAARVLWVTEEDGARLVAFRLGLMLAARGDADPRIPLLPVVRPGWNLETPAGQAALLAEVDAARPEVLVVDPLRASLPSIDAGPRDAAEARGFLLRVLRETSVRLVWGIHHDVKPPSTGRDERARAERASGGVTFSMADTLVNFERVDDRAALAVPTCYKVSGDPAPFSVRWETASPPGQPFAGFLRALAADADESGPERDRVLAFVRDTPWLATSEIEAGVRVQKGATAGILAQLEAHGLVRRETGPAAQARGRKANANLWGPA